MKWALRIVLVLTLLPPILGLAGMWLSHVAGCSGMDHIEYCARPELFRAVAFLIAFVWISVFVVPVGVALLCALGLIWWLIRLCAGEDRASSPTGPSSPTCPPDR
ncbi:MAG: hypothetical protein HY852_12485 [Bradyrhizobium sp.]|uniref:hypothetical protein n=1 Tax=Bradyrhizobium sp. TaxID=376 RepID=UPI0025C6133A|nr:hypothetical protein [Bradyrhizobium sp.]MBI5262621.1 hypothetical protein [Bradyrhizobium sp.]